MPVHPTRVEVSIELEDLARRVADLRYDALARFLGNLVCELSSDASKDEVRGRKQLAAKMDNAIRNLRFARSHMDEAWRVCAPRMDEGK